MALAHPEVPQSQVQGVYSPPCKLCVPAGLWQQWNCPLFPKSGQSSPTAPPQQTESSTLGGARGGRQNGLASRNKVVTQAPTSSSGHIQSQVGNMDFCLSRSSQRWGLGSLFSPGLGKMALPSWEPGVPTQERLVAARLSSLLTASWSRSPVASFLHGHFFQSVPWECAPSFFCYVTEVSSVSPSSTILDHSSCCPAISC